MSDVLAARFAHPGHPYPELCRAGLAHVWVGPRRNDFEPWILKAAVNHLKKHECPHELGDAKTYIRNAILRSDWGAIELREEEGEALARREAEKVSRSPGQHSPQPSPAGEGAIPKAGLDLTDEERAERQRQIAEVKRRLGFKDE